MSEKWDEAVRVYVASGGAEDAAGGVYLYALDLGDGSLNLVERSGGIDSANYLAAGPRNRYLFAASDPFGGQPKGAVHAFAVDRASGSLQLLNTQSSQGASACYVTVDNTGRCVLVANFRGVGGYEAQGSVALLPVEAEGRLGEATDAVRHEGSSVHPSRQTNSHCHSVVVGPANRYVYVADLGIDRVMAYRLNAERRQLVPHDGAHVTLAPGSGPRHFTFHPNGQRAYLINEISNTIVAYDYDRAAGILKEQQTVSTLPAGCQEGSACADVHVHPSGRFVYGSNRGHDSIVAFEIDGSTGRLDYVHHCGSGGEAPRGFCIDPSGRYMLVANRGSDRVVVLAIDADSGRLSSTAHAVAVPSAVCITAIAVHA